jgi:hypothetical protein
MEVEVLEEVVELEVVVLVDDSVVLEMPLWDLSQAAIIRPEFPRQVIKRVKKEEKVK